MLKFLGLICTFVSGKCSDLFCASMNGKEYDGYVPDDMNIGFGDYLEFGYCLDCGQIRGIFPLDPTEIERNISEEDEENSSL